MIFQKSLLITVSSLLVATFALPNLCYFCTNDPDDQYWPYDPTCGDKEYNGTYTKPTSNVADRCSTVIQENGFISRSYFMSYGDYEDGSCYTQHQRSKIVSIDCVCTTGDLCNTGTYCEECEFPFSTHHSTPSTTHTTTTATHATTPTTPGVTTTISTTSGMTITPPPATHYTTAPEETTTSKPEYLSCYSCYDCPEIDENTQVMRGPEIASCVTTLFFNSGIILRGESNDVMVDGDCHQHGDAIESVSCWCTSYLCNNQEVEELLNILEAEEKLIHL